MIIGILVIYRKKSCKLIFFRSGHDFVVILFIFSYTSSKVKNESDAISFAFAAEKNKKSTARASRSWKIGVRLVDKSSLI